MVVVIMAVILWPLHILFPLTQEYRPVTRRMNMPRIKQTPGTKCNIQGISQDISKELIFSKITTPTINNTERPLRGCQILLPLSLLNWR